MMKPRILFILHLPPPIHGAAMMGKYIHDSKLVNGTFDCHYINLATAKDLTDIGKVGIKKLITFAKLLKRIRKEVRLLKPRLVYVTPNAGGGAFYKDFIVVEVLKRMGCKVIVHYHNKGVATRQDCKFDDYLYKKFFNGVKVILLAENLYDDIKKYVKRENVVICNNGIPDVTADLHDIGKHMSKPLKMLYLSNMMEEKGVWVLIDACRILKERGLDFVCSFVGGWKDITEKAFHEKVLSSGLTVSTPSHINNEAAIIALGPKYGDDKATCFNQSDAFVFPTFYHNECFPLVLLEAMQHGLACISTNEAGIPDIIDNGKTGLIVQKKDSIALADSIEKLIINPALCLQMGKAGRKKYEERFTLNVFEQNICRILEGYSK